MNLGTHNRDRETACRLHQTRVLYLHCKLQANDRRTQDAGLGLALFYKHYRALLSALLCFSVKKTYAQKT